MTYKQCLQGSRKQPVHDNVSLFAPYFDDPSSSDIVVKAGETRLHAHKIVLTAHSALFKAMFQVLHSCLFITQARSSECDAHTHILGLGLMAMSIQACTCILP